MSTCKGPERAFHASANFATESKERRLSSITLKVKIRISLLLYSLINWRVNLQGRERERDWKFWVGECSKTTNTIKLIPFAEGNIWMSLNIIFQKHRCPEDYRMCSLCTSILRGRPFPDHSSCHFWINSWAAFVFLTAITTCAPDSANCLLNKGNHMILWVRKRLYQVL